MPDEEKEIVMNSIRFCFAGCFIALLVFHACAPQKAEASPQKYPAQAHLSQGAAHWPGLMAGIDSYVQPSLWAISQSVPPGEEESEYIFLTPKFSYKKPITVAIFPFSNDTGDELLEWLSDAIPENTIPKFTATDSVSLIDRRSVGAIIDQLGFTSSDLVDPAKALEVGKLLAAKIIVCGSYQRRSGDNLKILGRLTDVETGTILRAIEESGSEKNIDSFMEQASWSLVKAIDPNVRIDLPPMPAQRSRSGAALKSTIWPGWGDLPDRKASGILIGILQLGGLAASALLHLDHVEKLDEYEDASEKYGSIGNFDSYSAYRDQRELMTSKYEKAEDSRKLRNVIFISAVVGMRALGALESAIFVPRADVGAPGTASITGDAGIVLSWNHRF